MNAVELLEGDAPFVVDTSAWWRFSSLPSELIDKAIVDDRLWITPIVRMEILYSARSTTEYTAVETELDGFRILRNDRAVTDAAMSALGELAQRSDGYHRVPLTDTLIAARPLDGSRWRLRLRATRRSRRLQLRPLRDRHRHRADRLPRRPR